MTIIDCPLQKNASDLRHHAAIICGEREISYEQFHNMTSLTVRFFTDAGIKEGDRVAIFNPNSVQYLIALMALWRVKAVACPINTRLPEDAVDAQLKKINAKFLLSSIPAIIESSKISVIKFDLNKLVNLEFINSLKPVTELYQFSLDQDASILFTSGSSAEPKAVLHVFGNHFFSAKGSNENISIRPKDRWLLSLPLYHVGGLSILFRVLLGKGTIVLPDSEKSLDETLLKAKVTHLSLVSTQLFRLLNKKSYCAALKKLKCILLGGSAISAPILQKSIEEKLPVYITYGSTEMASQIATSEQITKIQQFGQAKILNYRKVRVSTDGEILVKGVTRFKGYVNGDQLELPVDEEGWFATGDIGRLSEDGYLSVIGRRDNMFISGGENIQAEEIERYLCQIQNIEQAIVVPVVNEEFGYRPVSFIKEADNVHLTKNEIVEKIKEHLPSFKVPDQFYVWPKQWDVSGLKVSRQRLSELVQNNNPDLHKIE